MKERIKKYVSLLAAFVLTLSMINSGGIISAQATPSASEKYFEDFEGYEIGYDMIANRPSYINYSNLSDTNTASVTADTLDLDNKCFGFYSTTANPTVRFFPDYDATKTLSGDNVTVGFKFMRKSTKEKIEFRVYSGSAYRRLILMDTGTAGSVFKCLTSSGEVQFGTYEVNRWYDFVLIFNTTNYTYSCYLDGELIEESANQSYYADKMKTSISYTYFVNNTNGGSSWLYIDDMRVYTAKDAPQLRSTFPENGSIDVSTADNIYLEFNNSMKNLNTENVVLTNNATGFPVSYTGTISGAKYRLKPTVPLDNNTSYTISVANGAKDIFGQDLASVPECASFTTGSQSLSIKNIGFTGTPQPGGDKITALKKGGYINYTVSFANSVAEVWNSELILAVYDAEGHVWKMKSVPVSLTKAFADINIGMELPADDVTGFMVKAFLWDSFGNVQPLQDAAVIPNP